MMILRQWGVFRARFLACRMLRGCCQLRPQGSGPACLQLALLLFQALLLPARNCLGPRMCRSPGPANRRCKGSVTLASPRCSCFPSSMVLVRFGCPCPLMFLKFCRAASRLIRIAWLSCNIATPTSFRRAPWTLSLLHGLMTCSSGCNPTAVYWLVARLVSSCLSWLVGGRAFPARTAGNSQVPGTFFTRCFPEQACLSSVCWKMFSWRPSTSVPFRPLWAVCRCW